MMVDANLTMRQAYTLCGFSCVKTYKIRIKYSLYVIAD
jgi:hypothetical protein